ncbi:MAG: PilZ domain-containing protein [Acidobacteriota bacterium]
MASRRRGVERRRWQRLPLSIPVFVRGVDERGKDFLELTTAFNVSAGGALLAMRRYLPRSSRVTLEIPSAPLPCLATPPDFVRMLRARLVRVTHSERYHLWGLKNERVYVDGRRRTAERRHWQRLPLAIPVFVRGVDGRGKKFLEFTTAFNVSAGGALLVTGRYLPRSSRITLEIPSAPLLRVAPPLHSVRTLRAQPIRVTHSDGGYLVNLKFTRPLV